MTLYLVRHGQTEENLEQILQGHLPGVLTDEGREQMFRAANRLKEMGIEFRCIVSSDLRRAMESAEIVSEKLGIKVTPMDMLRERDWGTYTGMAVSEAKERYYRDGKWDFPVTEHPVESEEELMARGREVLRVLKERYCDGNIIVVTHGFFARCIIGARCGCDFREVVPMVNAEVRVLTLPRE